jgi:hypothetical protein
MFEHPSRPATIQFVQPLAFAALGIVTVCAVALWFLGARFSRRYIAKHRARPPATWMFRATGDPDLEGPRRSALIVLPIFLIALLAYLLRP